MYVSKRRSKHINIIKFPWGGDAAVRMSLDDEIISKLPKLPLPYMPDKARTAFRALLEYEKPPGNGSVRDILELAETRGYCAHPADWIPSFEGDGQFPEIYQPVVAWLAENGHTPFYDGVDLTAKNLDSFTPSDLRMVFRKLLRKDRPAAYDLLLTTGTTKSAKVRLTLLKSFEYNTYYGSIYPTDIPVIKHFLSDRSEKIRLLAEKLPGGLNGFETEEDHAQEIAKNLRVENCQIFYSPGGRSGNLFGGELLNKARALLGAEKGNTSEDEPHIPGVHFGCTTFEMLAAALGLSSTELAQYWDLDFADSYFFSLLLRSGSEEARLIAAGRLLDAGKIWDCRFFQGADKKLWERGLRHALKSEFPDTVFKFPGLEKGSLNSDYLPEFSHYKGLAESITDELKDGTLPVNERYDPLRNVGLATDKNAAKKVLDEALSLDINPNNPRLTMLKFNLAL